MPHARKPPQATCHPERKNHARGLCSECYRRDIVQTPATCHPRRRHVAKGLCRECYQHLPENVQHAAYRRLERKYGLSKGDVHALLEMQNNKCAICATELPPHPKFHVDHDHATGRVRGVLCNFCNPGLGLFRDNINVLKKAIAYLERSNK